MFLDNLLCIYVTGHVLSALKTKRKELVLLICHLMWGK